MIQVLGVFFFFPPTGSKPNTNPPLLLINENRKRCNKMYWIPLWCNIDNQQDPSLVDTEINIISPSILQIRKEIPLRFPTIVTKQFTNLSGNDKISSISPTNTNRKIKIQYHMMQNLKASLHHSPRVVLKWKINELSKKDTIFLVENHKQRRTISSQTKAHDKYYTYISKREQLNNNGWIQWRNLMNIILKHMNEP